MQVETTPHHLGSLSSKLTADPSSPCLHRGVEFRASYNSADHLVATTAKRLLLEGYDVTIVGLDSDYMLFHGLGEGVVLVAAPRGGGDREVKVFDLGEVVRSFQLHSHWQRVSAGAACMSAHASLATGWSCMRSCCIQVACNYNFAIHM